jgi:TIR domain
MLGKSVELFISYSHRDEVLRQQLDKHLASLQRQKVIETWHDRKIEAGMEWAKQIDESLNKADIILLLISPDFICSNYCAEIEMEQALKRHEAGEAIVVPIILEPCDWTWLPFSKYQAFPKNAKPITTWSNLNEAFLDVTQGIRTAAERLFKQQQQKLQEKEIAQQRYLQKIQEILALEGDISIPGQDTLDELREELKLTSEETSALKNRAFEPYKRYRDNLQKYEKTFIKILQQEYPLSDKSKESMRLRQRDLGIKTEDAELIEKRLLAQAEVSGLGHLQEEVATPNLQQQAERKQSLDLDDSQLTNRPKTTELAQARTEQSTAQSTAIDPLFLARCQKELARYIGPMAQFILEDAIADHPQIQPQQLVELLSAEIPNSSSAKQFKTALS